jgi:hypothetical protein
LGDEKRGLEIGDFTILYTSFGGGRDLEESWTGKGIGDGRIITRRKLLGEGTHHRALEQSGLRKGKGYITVEESR